MDRASRLHSRAGMAAGVLRPPRYARFVSCAAEVKLNYETTAFKKELVEFAGEPEYIVKGGRDKFKGLPQAFEGIKEVLPSVLRTGSARKRALGRKRVVLAFRTSLALQAVEAAHSRRLTTASAIIGASAFLLQKHSRSEHTSLF
jgi:hypothetical protein